jgi:hypothetical protein
VTAKYANHAKKEAAWGFPSRIWRISRLNLFASGRRPRPGLCAPVVKIRATTPRCPVSFRQQSQTWAPSGIWGRRAGEPIVRNKPNSRRCRATGVLYKQTQFPGGTRPGGQARGCDYAKQTQFGQSGGALEGETCETNPISRRERLCETKPNLGELGHLGRRCAGEPIVRNKANSRRVSSVKCQVSSVKRESPASNLPTSDFTLQTFGGTPVAEGQPCETKPIWRWHDGQVLGGKRVMVDSTCARNEPNLGRSAATPGAYWAKRSQSGDGRAASGGRNARNKPNFRGRFLGTKDAKQTQFLECGLCQTNPIGASRRGPGEQNAPNKPNSRQVRVTV